MTFFTTTSTVLSQKGYDHYEVSNFSLSPSSRSRHNLKYWRHIPYLGLGPSAHSFSDGRRWWNIENAHDYITGIAGSRKVVSQSEDLITEQLALEALFLGLRTKDGIDLSKYKAEYGTDLLHDKKKTIAELKKNKLIEIKEGRLRPTLAGMAVADSLALI
jgi:oxygen-independent coproporphyrinogen-3 oxidase